MTPFGHMDEHDARAIALDLNGATQEQLEEARSVLNRFCINGSTYRHREAGVLADRIAKFIEEDPTERPANE